MSQTAAWKAKGKHHVQIRPLLPSQRYALARIHENPRIALFMEMRLGKSATSIRWLDTLPERPNPVLIVSPAETLYTWKRELALEGHRSAILTGPLARRIDQVYQRGKQGVTFFITNWQAIALSDGRKRAKPASFVSQIPWHAIILDESPRIKNPKSKTAKIALKYLSRAPYKAILSGLPNPEDPLDLANQFIFLHGQFMGCRSFYDFRDRYFHNAFGYEWVPKKGTYKRIREHMRSLAVVLTARDAGMANTIMHTHRTFDLPPSLHKEYHKIESEWATSTDTTKWIVVVRNWLLQLCGRMDTGKFNWINENITQSHAVVWFRYNQHLHEVFHHLLKGTHHVYRITGENPRSARERIIKRFKKKGGILLAQVKALRFGVDLTPCSTSIYWNQIDSLEDRLQTEKRFEGPKQKEPVMHVDLIVRHSVEEDIWHAMQQKDITAKFFMQRAFDHFKRRIKAVVWPEASL